MLDVSTQTRSGGSGAASAELEDSRRFAISREQIEQIGQVAHLLSGDYAKLDIAATLDFYKKRYVDQLGPFRVLDANSVVADIGAGYGWLAMAMAAFTPASVIAVEIEGERLRAGREIARILGLEDRIQWVEGGLGSLELPDRCADVVYCIEVIEHVRGDDRAIRDLARLSRDLLIVTTPNKWFPVVAHDTRLPFCHWLPLGARTVYARLFGRTDSENDNIFWSPARLRRVLADYRAQSRFLHYASVDRYLDTYPIYVPYNRGAWRQAPSRAKTAFYRLAALLGRHSDFVLPNLAHVYRRV